MAVFSVPLLGSHVVAPLEREGAKVLVPLEGNYRPRFGDFG
jgi:hypothetical protein